MDKHASGNPKGHSLHKAVMPVARHFWPLALLVVALTAVAIYGLGLLRIENDLMYMLPDDNQAKNAFLDDEERFGNSVGIVLAFHSGKGIYQADLTRRLEKFSQSVLHLNTRLLAKRLQKVAPLSENQAVLLASWLQGQVSDPTFSADDFSAGLADPDATAENMGDFAPVSLAGQDIAALAKATAQKLAQAAKARPDTGKLLVDAVLATTDRRGKEHSRWVDRIIGLTRTDSAWPELVHPEKLAELLAGWGFADDKKARAFLSLAMEAGVNGPKALASLLADQASLAKSGIDQPAAEGLSGLLTGERAGRFLLELQKAPKRIRVAEMVDLKDPASPTPRQLNELKLRLKAWSFFQGTLRSPDDKSTLLVIRTAPNLTKESREELLLSVQELLKKDFANSGYQIYEAGEAVVDHEISGLMTEDIRRLLPIVVGVVAAFLFISLRSVAGVVYPLVTVLLSTLWCVGFMGFVDLPVSIVGTVLPVLLVAVGSAYGIHFVNYFSEAHGNGQPRERVVASAVDVTGLGVLIAGLTTVAGFGSLGANSIIALRDFGLAIAIGVTFALLLSLYLIPALLIKFGDGRVGKRRPAGEPTAPGGGGVHRKAAAFFVAHPWLVVVCFLGVLAVGGVGLSRLEVEMNNMNFFRPGSDIRTADDFINRNMAGTVGMRAVFDTGRDNGALDPAVLKVLRELAARLPKDNPEVGKVVSVVDMISKMNQAFHYNDPAYYRLPDLADLAGQKTAEALLGQYVFYVDKFSAKDRQSVLDVKKRVAVLNIQVKTAASSVSSRIRDYIGQELAGPLGEPLRKMGVKTSITGIGALYKEASDLLIRGQMLSVALSMVIVLVLVAFTMRSMVYGLLSILPLGITIVFNFGLMGLAGIPLDAGTAITACVAVGIGVDYSIHYLNRYRLCRDDGMAHPQAAAETAAGSGKAILINAVSVAAGFLVLTLSSFVPLFNLGILIALTMIITALGSLSLVPALLTIADNGKNRGRSPAAASNANGEVA